MSKGLVVALSGGVGGAKLALGLSRVLPADELLVVANTGDDFEHLGLSISPDIDTLMYTLAGLDNPETGWGRRGETWFKLGDADLAVHVERTRRLRAGESLSRITAGLCRRLGVPVRIVPMSDDPVRTRIRSDEYVTRVRRPLNALLDCRMIADVHGVELPSWEPSLRTCVERFLAT